MEPAEPIALHFDAHGLVTVVAQHWLSGEVRMVGHANAEAVARTLQTSEAWFFSRSRSSLWRKGETSGHVMRVHEVWADCDADALVYLVDPVGPTCHTQATSCFFRPLDARAKAPRALPVLAALGIELETRRAADAGKSYTKSLLEAGPERIAAKVIEEAGELAQALTGETDERVVSEAADVLYHVMVGLLARGKTLDDVAAELARRSGTSGHAEKASRAK